MRCVLLKGGPLNDHRVDIEYDDQTTFTPYISMGSWVSEHRYIESPTDRCVFIHESGEYRFIVETDQPDEDGTTIDLSGIEMKDKTPISLNFSRDIKDVVGSAKLWVYEGNLWCQARLKNDVLDLYPAIGFSIISWEDRPDKTKHYSAIKISQIGLCVKPNLNPTIKTVREQIQAQS